MAALLDRARSVFRRRDREDDRDSGPGDVIVLPDGTVTTRPHSQDPTGPRPHNPDHHPGRPHAPDHHQHHPGRPHPPHQQPHPPHSPQHPPRPHQPQHHPRPHPPDPGDGTQQPPPPTTPATRSGYLQIALENDTNSSNVFAYITGLAIDRGNAVFLLSADAETPYYPPSPPSTGNKLAVNVSIDLGRPGNVVYATVPRLAGARIWFSIGAPLQFALNPGPGLVEPSIFNPSDPNHNVTFGFAEFTFNNAQVFANISYVDFVGLPIAMTLEDTNGGIQHVSGIPANGLQIIANGLQAQTARDGRRWSSLIVNRSNGQLLRILSPNSGLLLNPSWFQTYWTDYVGQVYNRYTNDRLQVDTQASFGNASGKVDSARNLNFGAGGSFQRPTAADIFSCSTGPFATGSNAQTNTIIPRLAAAFNRSTLLISNNQPDGVSPRQYYREATTNHYARIVHAANLDGRGYAFPYDDVTPDGGVPQEGAVFSYSPARLIVSVGGTHAYVR